MATTRWICTGTCFAAGVAATDSRPFLEGPSPVTLTISVMEGRKATDLAAAFRKLYGHAEDDQTTFGQVLEMDGQIDALLATPGWAVM
jgi:hypothetical protein